MIKTSKNMKAYNQTYNKIEKKGGGTFGIVYKIHPINDENTLYAMKKYYLDHVNNS
jgi:hypothetical protein